MTDYRKATLEDLEQIWNRSIQENPDDPAALAPNYLRLSQAERERNEKLQNQ